MGIAFDHSQKINDIRLILGSTDSQIKHAAPFIDRELYRSIIDPGFSASVRFLEGDLFFRGGSSVIQNVTWKWQARELGATAWVDLHTAVTEQWTGGTDTGIRVGLDDAALTASADSAPLEIRMIASAATAATVSVFIGASYATPAVRIFGESI